MKNDNETQIVWRLSKAEKGRYVAAARAAGVTLIAWLKSVADAGSEPIANDPGESPSGDMARQRSRMDSGRGRPPGDDA